MELFFHLQEMKQNEKIKNCGNVNEDFFPNLSLGSISILHLLLETQCSKVVCTLLHNCDRAQVGAGAQVGTGAKVEVWEKPMIQVLEV